MRRLVQLLVSWWPPRSPSRAEREAEGGALLAVARRPLEVPDEGRLTTTRSAMDPRPGWSRSCGELYLASPSGLTLLEVMIASAVMVIMMTLAWQTIANTSDRRRTFQAYEERNHELRMALDRCVRDFQAAYLSRNEDTTANHPRTLFVSASKTPVPDVRFSTLGHRPLWADANESDQTVIQYLARANPGNAGQIDWIRREQRRQSNLPPEEQPSDYDVLVHDIVNVKLEFWNWKNLEWQETWDTTQSDAQRGWLPSRVKITVTVKGSDGKDVALSTQARVSMQEPLNFSPT